MGGIPTLLTHIVSIKREIGHLCHDESRQPKQGQTMTTTAPTAAQVSAPGTSLFFLASPFVPVHATGALTRDMDVVCVIDIMHLELFCRQLETLFLFFLNCAS
jgi:hypothetical protein